MSCVQRLYKELDKEEAEEGPLRRQGRVVNELEVCHWIRITIDLMLLRNKCKIGSDE